MYDEYLKLETYKSDWSVRNNAEDNNVRITNEKSGQVDEKKSSWKLQGKKKIGYHGPSIRVSPLTI